MIALVTSTLIPTNAYSLFDVDERLSQTLHTVEKLYAAGFADIYLFDNSIDTINLAAITKKYPSVKISHSPQYTFGNKGLNEALLILNNIHHLPHNTPIFKISGRYYPNENFNIQEHTASLKSKELIGTGSYFHNNNAHFNTRAYFVKDKGALESILVLAVEEMISYSKGIHGIKSFLQAIKNIYNYRIGTLYQLSLEQVFARIARKRNNYILIDKLNIEGYIAGSAQREFIFE
ncbi:MAG: hypothetical protein JWQ66_2549 [Mucilaginibacter sp.]|nr:hypothetical protein [Mucilaginibacter sp.]